MTFSRSRGRGSPPEAVDLLQAAAGVTESERRVMPNSAGRGTRQAPAAAFARRAYGEAAAAEAAAPPAPPRTEWDEVDELFRGG